MASKKRSISIGSDIHALHKELDEVSCPICMDHPHNAILILCSSHEKGCRSYICDTSYRHSNCLDRFRKLSADKLKNPSPPNLLVTDENGLINTSDRDLGSRTISNMTEAHENHNLDESANLVSHALPEGQRDNAIDHADGHLELQAILGTGNHGYSLRRPESEENSAEGSSIPKLGLRCPLCRGTVLGWEVVEEAREYLNMKSRSCTRESCSFLGNYRELRRHARRVHPSARPADTDPSRQRAWRRLEHQRDYGDLVSAIRSAMPGAVVLGDYVIESGDRDQGERDRGSNRPWWTTFFLFQMIGSMDRAAEPRGGRSRVWRRHRRSTGASSSRRFLWGENLLGLHDEDDDEDENEDIDLNALSDAGNDASPIPRRRRRLTRSRSDEDEP